MRVFLISLGCILALCLTASTQTRKRKPHKSIPPKHELTIDELLESVPDATPSPTPQLEWALIGSTSASRFYYNTKSTQAVDASVVRAWIKIMPRSEEARRAFIEGRGDVAATFVNYAYRLELIECDCKNRRLWTKTVYCYDDAGKVIYSTSADVPL